VGAYIGFEKCGTSVGLSRIVAFWLVQGDASGAVWNGVQLRATLWDGFVGSNVGFSCRQGQGFGVSSSLLREAAMEGERARARDLTLIAEALQAHGALHPDLNVEEATDVLLVLVSPQAHQMLRRDRRRSLARYRSTLLKALERALLREQEQRR